MANTAAHLVDRVLPAVPLRQWVLSLPFELRRLAAFDAKVLATLARVFAEALSDRYRQWGRGAGSSSSQTGAVTFVQRFGSSLNLNVHLHVVVLDGVFVRDEGGSPIFRSAPPPSKYELDAVLARVHRRVFAWLGRHRYVNTSPSEALSHETPSPTPLEACADLAMRRGTTTAVRDSGDEEDGKEIFTRAAPAHDAVDLKGFNLDASVHIDADDDLGRERLCRYGARLPFSLERFRALPGGRVGYRVKKARGGRAKVLVLTPLELLARLAALIPPPRHPLVRYHGVLAPRSSWRKAVVPRRRRGREPHARHTATGAPTTEARILREKTTTPLVRPGSVCVRRPRPTSLPYFSHRM